MLGAGVEAKMEGCAMLPAIRLVSEAAEVAAHRHDAQGAPGFDETVKAARRLF